MTPDWTCDAARSPCWSSVFLNDCTLYKRTHPGAVCEWEGLHAEAGIQDDEEVAVPICYELITTLISHLNSPPILPGVGTGRIGGKSSLRRKTEED